MAQSPVNQVPAPTLADVFGPSGSTCRFAIPDRDFAYVGSGKAAIAVLLGYLRETGALPNKMGHVLVSAWMGVQVYQTILASAVPTLYAGAELSAIVPYHQFGFPQDMDRVRDFAADRKIAVIEDCAHAADSSDRGRRLGSLGDYALFSFSKFNFCYTLGGIAYKDPSFGEYLERVLSTGSRPLRRLLNAVKLADEANLARRKPRMPVTFNRVRKAAYALYGDSPLAAPRAIRLWQRHHERELRTRRERYGHLRERLDGTSLCDHLEPEGVTPWIVPLRMPETAARKAADDLRAAGIEAGLYRFDVNRFLVEPKFVQCLAVPCHGRIPESRFEQIIDIVRTSI